MTKTGDRVMIDVLALEYVEGSHTIWIHGKGGTVLRIKTVDGEIRSDACAAPTPHGDVIATGNIRICVPTT